MSYIKNHITYCFSLEVAQKYGIHSALVLNRIIYSINFHAESPERWKAKYFIDEVWWMDDTYEAISRHFQGLIAARTVRGIMKTFEDDGLIISRKMNAAVWDHTKWYTVDLQRFNFIFTDASRQDASRCVTPGRIDGSPDDASSYSNNHPNSHTNSPAPLRGLIEICEGVTGQIVLDMSGKPAATFFNGNGWTTPSPIADGESLLDCYRRIFPKEQKGTALALKSQVGGKGEGKVQKAKYEQGDLPIAEAWLQFALSEMKWKKPLASWTVEQFAEDLAKVRRATDLNFDGLRALLEFIKRDDFWRPNALSPNGLLKKSSNGNRKIDNILLKMKPKNQGKYERALEAVAAMEREGKDPF